MRYLWEVLLEAKKEQIPEERLRFVHAPQGSGHHLANPRLQYNLTAYGLESC